MTALLPTLAHWFLLAFLVWVALGVLGTALSASRGEWARARTGLLSLVGGIALYLGLLLAISSHQPTHVLSPAQSRCFGPLCFQVVGAEEPMSFRPRAPNRESMPLPNVGGTEPDRLLRVEIRITNSDGRSAHREPGLTAYLVDAQGRRFEEVPGLAGVPLSAPIQSRGAAVSSPVFRVAPDSRGLRLILTHRGWYAGRLTLGDPESLLHRPEEMSFSADQKSRIAE